MMNGRMRFGLGALCAVAVIALLHPICNFVFECGCSALWSGGAGTCELMPGAVPAAQACPWCAAHPLVQLGVVGGVWGLAFAFGDRLASNLGFVPGLGAALVLSVVLLFCAAWVMGALAGYPGASDRPVDTTSFCSGSPANG